MCSLSGANASYQEGCPKAESEEISGMALAAAVPVFDAYALAIVQAGYFFAPCK
jgi:hypothetical protein